VNDDQSAQSNKPLDGSSGEAPSCIETLEPKTYFLQIEQNSTCCENLNRESHVVVSVVSWLCSCNVIVNVFDSSLVVLVFLQQLLSLPARLTCPPTSPGPHLPARHLLRIRRSKSSPEREQIRWSSRVNCRSRALAQWHVG